MTYEKRRRDKQKKEKERKKRKWRKGRRWYRRCERNSDDERGENRREGSLDEGRYFENRRESKDEERPIRAWERMHHQSCRCDMESDQRGCNRRSHRHRGHGYRDQKDGSFGGCQSHCCRKRHHHRKNQHKNQTAMKQNKRRKMNSIEEVGKEKKGKEGKN